MVGRDSSLPERRSLCATSSHERLSLNFKEILELIDKVADRGIALVEVERAGTKVRVEGKSAAPQMMVASPAATSEELHARVVAAAPPSPPTAAANAAAAA